MSDGAPYSYTIRRNKAHASVSTDTVHELVEAWWM
jgi:hypothetical protein